MNSKVTMLLLSTTVGLSMLASPLGVAAKEGSNSKENQPVTQSTSIKNSFPDAGNGSRFLVNYYDRYMKKNNLGAVARFPENNDFEVKNSYGKLVMEPEVISDNPLWAGQSDLRNDTDREQTLSSSEFHKTFTNTTTSSTDHGFTVGSETEVKTGIPFLAEGKISLKAEYNFNSTQANETSETVEYIAPSQSIIVPPHTIARVNAVLDVRKIKGKMDLYSEIGLKEKNFDYDKLPISSYGQLSWVSLGSIYEDAYNEAKLSGTADVPDIKVISRSSNNPDYFLASGTGSFESEYGSIFNVQVEYISTKNQEVKKTENFTIQPRITSIK